MKLCILYHPESDHASTVETFASECRRSTENEVELISLESREGASLASLYDTTEYPALLVLRNDGQLIKDWQGDILPMASDVLGSLNT